MKRMISFMLVLLLLLPLSAAAETAKPFPLYEASFLQAWLCRDWTKARFADELTDMKAAGFRSLILQSVADLTHTETWHSETALYPSSLAADSEQSRALEYALQAAEETGMRIWIGLVSDDRWWDYGWNHPDAAFRDWIVHNTADQCTVIRELAAQYGTRFSAQIAGFYYTNEIWNITPEFAAEYAPFYSEQLAAVRNALSGSFPGYPMMLSPFYNKTLGEPEGYAVILSDILRGASPEKGDILAIQDGAGRGYDAETLRLWQDAVYDACSSQVTVWVNNETFASDYTALFPERLRADRLATASAARHILFSWNHYYHGKAQESDFDSRLRRTAGDVNADGCFDAEDVRCLLQWLTVRGRIPADWNAGDADGNGTLNAADLTLLKQQPTAR